MRWLKFDQVDVVAGNPGAMEAMLEAALLHEVSDSWLERSALPQSPAQSDGPRMTPHGFHSFFRVLGAHAFKHLVDQIHVPSFEIEVLVLLRVGVVRGVL